MKLDLHLHSYYSDGLFSPKKLVDFALERGIDGIALTDHDSILGVEELITYTKEKNDFYFVPGIEFSCIYKGEEVHILGYYINHENKNLLDLISHIYDSRKKRGMKILETLNSASISITFDDLKVMENIDFIGRVQVARALVKKNYAKDLQDAFNKFLIPGKIGYVDRFKLDIKDAIDIIKGAGGIPVIAHPGIIRKYQEDAVFYAIKSGVEGIECIHSKHNKSTRNHFLKIARQKNLLVTGGSDCHGEIINGDLLLGKHCTDESILILKGEMRV